MDEFKEKLDEVISIEVRRSGAKFPYIDIREVGSKVSESDENTAILSYSEGFALKNAIEKITREYYRDMENLKAKYFDVRTAILLPYRDKFTIWQCTIDFTKPHPVWKRSPCADDWDCEITGWYVCSHCGKTWSRSELSHTCEEAQDE